MLGFVAEAVAGEPLDTFLQKNVFTPLGMTDTHYRPDASLRGRIAPTEITPPRGYPIRGEVHDENAYALGGVAGHAGLFSTASDLSVFAQMLLDGGSFGGTRIVADSTVRLFTRRSAGTRALGWDTCAGHGGCGKYMGVNAYGHTGFTGTSLWIDPDREMFVILLTNRVHAARARRPAKVISDVRADLADAAALAVTDSRDGMIDMPDAFRSDLAVGWNQPDRAARGRNASRRGKHSRSSARSTAKSGRSGRSSSKSSARKSTSSSKSSAHAKSSAKSSGKSTAKKSKSTAKSTAKHKR
jgi:hypothetical protein